MPSHKHIFEQVITPCFIETGYFKGEGVQLALDVGFSRVESIEIAEDYWRQGLIKYHNDPRVKIHLGASEDKLWDVIKDINTQITFWLDGHFSGPGTPKGEHNTPLLQELEIISKHPIKNHKILIDDCRCCGTELFDYITRQQLEESVLKINSNYIIRYLDSWERADIMYAWIKE